VVLRVQAKWSQRMDRHNRPFLTFSEKFRNFFRSASGLATERGRNLSVHATQHGPAPFHR
jgi:hypothetical protein